MAIALAMVTISVVVGNAEAASALCVGDCDGDGEVLVDELLLGVGIAQQHQEPSVCKAADVDDNGVVSVEELVATVRSVIDDCTEPLREAFVVATDFQTGSFATIALDPPRRIEPASPERRVHRDAVARAFGGHVYVVNRFFGDTIQILDPADNFATIATCSVGRGANPHDIAFLNGDKAYVTRYELTELLVVDPTVGPDCAGFVRGTVDLAPFADDDGIPEMDQMLIVGNRLFVSLQRLDRTNLFVPAVLGRIAVIDVTRDEVIGTVTLSGANPYTLRRARNGGRLSVLVTETGTFGSLDGGLEYIDVESAEAQGFFVTEEDLGADITGALLVSERLGYAVLSDQEFRSSVVAFDPTTRTMTQTLVSGSNFIPDIELNDRDELYVADRTVNRPGIRIFAAGDGSELTPEPLDVGLPPFEILFLR